MSCVDQQLSRIAIALDSLFQRLILTGVTVRGFAFARHQFMVRPHALRSAPVDQSKGTDKLSVDWQLSRIAIALDSLFQRLILTGVTVRGCAFTRGQFMVRPHALRSAPVDQSKGTDELSVDWQLSRIAIALDSLFQRLILTGVTVRGFAFARHQFMVRPHALCGAPINQSKGTDELSADQQLSRIAIALDSLFQRLELTGVTVRGCAFARDQFMGRPHALCGAPINQSKATDELSADWQLSRIAIALDSLFQRLELTGVTVTGCAFARDQFMVRPHTLCGAPIDQSKGTDELSVDWQLSRIAIALDSLIQRLELTGVTVTGCAFARGQFMVRPHALSGAAINQSRVTDELSVD